ncbi:MAG: serine hydroxymethyltransferase [Saprospiraceae bacterium]|uniref:Serine hydroxymethyltransferase n=1 Tax=Candidatus Defluviibacterium haderslevense TaxID=2981993 RepID=A0A9D7S9Q1_9BACT|nr:serine hydroxymethyltransferase [Candidatus Defluviibacterium haderslevense]
MQLQDQLIRGYMYQELDRQRRGVELIASENFASLQVIQSMGSWLTNKYAEGYPGKRYYGGCEVVDEIEQIAIDRLCELFGASYANVQPHSGASANMAVQISLLSPGDTIMGLDLAHGGHLTHGSPVNISGKYFKVVSYGVDADGRIDMNDVADKALAHRPKLIICGASAYSRDFDYARFRKIADEVNAVLWADIAHPAGLIASKLLNDPIKHCHILTSTTHKTLRGPRGGIIMMGQDFDNPIGKKDKKGKLLPMSTLLQSAVFPGTQGGPLEHIIASKAIAFGEALSPAFKTYSKQVIDNAQAFAHALQALNYNLVSGGTDNHLFLLDLRNKDITGKEMEHLLIKADITTNKNMIPNDPQPPMTTSGIRLGTAAMTSRGFKEKDFVQVSEWINELVIHRSNDVMIESIKKKVNQYMEQFPLYPEIGA